jgi:AcrR family transcriptional regulator
LLVPDRPLADDAGMASKTSPKYEANRAAILDAATRAYAAQGYTRVSLARIAAALGRSAGFVRTYFLDKPALLGAIAKRHFDRLFAALDRADPAEDAAPLPAPRLERLAARYLGFLLGEGADGHRVLRQFAADPASGVGPDLSTMRGWLAALFDDALAETLPGLAARPDLAARLALMLLALLEAQATPGALAAAAAQRAVAAIGEVARQELGGPAIRTGGEAANPALPASHDPPLAAPHPAALPAAPDPPLAAPHPAGDLAAAQRGHAGLGHAFRAMALLLALAFGGADPARAGSATWIARAKPICAARLTPPIGACIDGGHPHTPDTATAINASACSSPPRCNSAAPQDRPERVAFDRGIVALLARVRLHRAGHRVRARPAIGGNRPTSGKAPAREERQCEGRRFACHEHLPRPHIISGRRPATPAQAPRQRLGACLYLDI